jgi:hypothetical protein
MTKLTITSEYLKWVSDRMWNNGLHLFADSEDKQDIERIAFQISRSKEPTIVKRKYRGTDIFMVYQERNQFPLVPTMYYYSVLDPIEGAWLYLSDVISAYRTFLNATGELENPQTGVGAVS